MKIVRQEVKTYKTQCKCDCGGELLPTGTVLLSNPPIYPHKCNKCDFDANFREMYPVTEYVEVK